MDYYPRAKALEIHNTYVSPIITQLPDYEPTKETKVNWLLIGGIGVAGVAALVFLPKLIKRQNPTLRGLLP